MNLSVNNIDLKWHFSERDDRRSDVVECDEAAFELLVAHQQLAKAVEPAVAYLDNPASGFLLRIAALGVRLFTAINHMRDVVMRLVALQSTPTAISRICAQVFGRGQRPFTPDHDGREHSLKLRDIMPSGAGHDERQRDATLVHQQVALASIWLGTHRSPPIREISCGSRWHCQNAPWAAPSTGSPCAVHTRWPQTPAAQAWGAVPRRACACTSCHPHARVVESAVRHAARNRPSQPMSQPAWQPSTSPRRRTNCDSERESTICGQVLCRARPTFPQ